MHGPMNTFVDSGKIDVLKTAIDKQITKVLKNIDWDHLDIFTTLEGIVYLLFLLSHLWYCFLFAVKVL